MKLLKPLLLLTFSLLIGSVSAQDMHFTMYNMSPLTMNPALSGAFSGTLRLGGIYRNQAFSVSNARSYSTPSFYADAPIVRGFRKQDWVGVGISFLSDKSGFLKLETTRAALSASYHLGLNKQGTSVLTLGLQAGGTTRRITQPDPQDNNYVAIAASEIFPTSVGGGGAGGIGDPVLNADRKALTDYAAGLLFRTVINDDSNLELGFSTSRIAISRRSNAGYAFIAQGEGLKRPLLFAAHAKYEMPVTEKWSIAPTAFWQMEGSAMEILLQGWAGYQINEDFKLNFGLGYRFGDALNVLVGADYKDELKVGLAYDVTLSSLSDANNYSGGVEIGAWYIIRKYKKPVVKPKVLCPRF
jgi:type IX secretion system PorP/SprF family membrane protein